MNRRTFILQAASGAALAAAAADLWQIWETDPRVDYPGRSEGHWLRDNAPLPSPDYVLQTDVVILGSGVAGLTAAWKLNREGHTSFLLIDGPQAFGNAAAGRFGELRYPTGAHYLPLPSVESFHVREILSDLGVLLDRPDSENPRYDERFLLHAPEERLLINGEWQVGLIPEKGVDNSEKQQQERFVKQMERLCQARGADGRRLFVLPLAACSSDLDGNNLDRISFKRWLDEQGYTAPSLLWYLDYCCRDDYGASIDQVSAWAGLHYFCGRSSETQDGGRSWLTWPEGLHALAAGLERACRGRRRRGLATRVRNRTTGVEVDCVEWVEGKPRAFLVRARKAICAMPLMVASRIVQGIQALGFDPSAHMPVYAPWMVSNFLMKQFPREIPDAPLSWDNVVYGGKGLGYVVSTHQDIRVSPPPKTVFTAYHALVKQTPEEARMWLQSASPRDLLEVAASDLLAAYGWKLRRSIEEVRITVLAHAMATPRPGFLHNAGLRALRSLDGPILFAHSDLSGFSVFEEASWWGYQAAIRALS